MTVGKDKIFHSSRFYKVTSALLQVGSCLKKARICYLTLQTNQSHHFHKIWSLVSELASKLSMNSVDSLDTCITVMELFTTEFKHVIISSLNYQVTSSVSIYNKHSEFPLLRSIIWCNNWSSMWNSSHFEHHTCHLRAEYYHSWDEMKYVTLQSW